MVEDLRHELDFSSIVEYIGAVDKRHLLLFLVVVLQVVEFLLQLVPLIKKSTNR